MLKTSASGVPCLRRSASRRQVASLRGSTYQISGGKEPIRSHVIEASGSSEAWYVPPRLFARCGLARGTGRLGAPGWAGETSGHFEHPATLTPSAPFDEISRLVYAYTEFSRNLLAPAGGELSEILRWITVTHTQRWHAHHHSAGTGPLYQGRFKSFPVQTDEHFLTVARYVERHALRAKLVTQAEGWQWSSLGRQDQGDATLTAWLSDWPVERPRDWIARVNRPQSTSELESLRLSVQRGRPFGDESWVRRMAKRFGMESTLRPRGRPKQS